MSSLRWTPLFDSIVELGSECNLLIAPFIQSDAIKAFLNRFDNRKLQVITSWTAANLASGVSDPEVFPLLDAMEIPLYINSDIHLKLFVFENDVAFHTSANITAKGLGLCPKPNVEIGCSVDLGLNDWLQINELLETSSRVTDELYQKAQRYAKENKNAIPPLPPLVLATPTGTHPFSRQSLPQCLSPEELWEFYSTGATGESSRAACMHDLWIYNITATGLPRDEFLRELGNNFRTQPFVTALVRLLQDKGTLHFGAVNAWITSNCSDRPTPTRWELKPATNRLYDWLSLFFPEISWSSPRYSQILRWTKPPE